MSRRNVILLVALSAIWGSSFLFIKVGVRELSPSVVVLGRLVVGTVVLLPLAAPAFDRPARRGCHLDRAVRPRPAPCLSSGLEATGRGSDARRPRLRHRVPPLLRPDPRCRRVEGDPRDLPRAGVRARLWSS